MANVNPPSTIAHIAPFTIEAEQKVRFIEVAEANHRTITQQLRHLIAEAIAEADREPEDVTA